MEDTGFIFLVNFLKMVIIFLLMVQLVPVLVWAERRGSAFIQNRLGPNRIGPLGLFHLLTDAVKFAVKEEFMPKKGHRFLFYTAPIMALIPASLALGAIPLSIPFEIGGYSFKTQVYDMGVGIVFVLGISSLGAYSLLMAGWGSANKFSLYGALRASAQMISYELALGLSIVGILMVYGSFNFTDMINAQTQPLVYSFWGKSLTIPIPAWGIFYQPLGALLFFVATFAETNRLPFDLPEAESELVAGYHTEYGGMKMNMFYIGEYGHMMVASALMAIFYFGGYNLPFVTEEGVRSLVQTLWNSSLGLVFSEIGATGISVLTMLVFHIILFIKIVIFLFIFIWVRWSFPRFRYDQLMDLGWKTMLPWALFNTVLTALFMLLAKGV